MKWLLFLFAIVLILISGHFFIQGSFSGKIATRPINQKLFPRRETSANKKSLLLRTKRKAITAKQFAEENSYSTKYSFLIDMSLPSGKNRFFIYDLLKDSVIHTGLVSHGNCRSGFLEEPVFSNIPECGCSSVGKYKIGSVYEGQFGKAFKLHGLESTNSNAFKRTIVLHAYDCVPDEETYPQPICNSLGCPMVSYKFLKIVEDIITLSRKPVLLWIYN